MTKKVAIIKSDTFIDPITKKERIHELFTNFFSQSSYDLTFYEAVNNQLPDPYKYDLYLITGSKYSVYEPLPWIRNLEDFINNHRLPKLIGFCFGHQLIAKARGGKVENCGWHVGVKPVMFYSLSLIHI